MNKMSSPLSPGEQPVESGGPDTETQSACSALGRWPTRGEHVCGRLGEQVPVRFLAARRMTDTGEVRAVWGH